MLCPSTEGGFRATCVLVGVALLVQRFGAVRDRALGVLTELALAVGKSTGKEDLLGSLDVGLLSLPRLEARRLQGAAKGEGKVPHTLGQRVLVERINDTRRVLLRVAARQKEDSGQGDGHSASQRAQRERSNRLRRLGSLGRRFSAGSHKGRLEQATLQQDLVLVEGSKDRGEHLLGSVGALLNRVRAVEQRLRLHNGDKPVRLRNGRIPSERLSNPVDRQLRRGTGSRVNLERAAPLGKPSAGSIVLVAPGTQVIKPLRVHLTVHSTGNLLESLVQLDAGNNAMLRQALGEGNASVVRLEQRLLKHNNARNGLRRLRRSGEHQLTPGTAKLFSVLLTNGSEALAHGTRGLISGKDSLTWRRNLVGSLNKLSSELTSSGHCNKGSRVFNF
mmetsp:Transcript_1923/g.6100  ORF Transcript_1923/g.6100 Transcript_1923/m.6100 type:complete len:390 (+) Transcript_1923:322-1491(+)